MKKNKTQTGMKKAVVRIIGNDVSGYYGKLGKRMFTPKRGEAAVEGTWIDKDSARRNLRKRLPSLGHDVGTFTYKYEYTPVA